MLTRQSGLSKKPIEPVFSSFTILSKPRITIGLSLITANVPLLKPFLKMLQSGLVDASVPKLSGSLQLSMLSGSQKQLKQSSATTMSDKVSRETKGSSRRFWHNDTPLMSNSGASIPEFFDDTVESGERDSDAEARHMWESLENCTRIES